VDDNHAEIKAALQQCGWTVIDTSRLGDGFADLLVARAGRIELIEVKDGDKPLSRQQPTEAEREFYLAMAAAGVRVRYVNAVEQVASL
jgi:hypothetical protein